MKYHNLYYPKAARVHKAMPSQYIFATVYARSASLTRSYVTYTLNTLISRNSQKKMKLDRARSETRSRHNHLEHYRLESRRQPTVRPNRSKLEKIHGYRYFIKSLIKMLAQEQN